MKSKKLAKHSLTKLSAKHDERKCELEAIRLAATQELYVELSALAQQMGVSLRHLVERGLKPGDKPPPVFYMNPADVSQQWHGRGTKPKWLRDWIEEGKSLDLVRF